MCGADIRVRGADSARIKSTDTYVYVDVCVCACVQAKVVIAEQTEKDIDETRSLYIPVAVNTQILFFCVADLSNIDPMYQYSLEWFIAIFLGGIANAERAGTSRAARSRSKCVTPHARRLLLKCG